jgi:hypothetical protein
LCNNAQHTTHTDTQEIHMSNKSGFELRTDILGMAQGLLEGNREQQIGQFYSINEEDRRGQKAPVIEITTDEVIKVARDLYEFVNEK